MRSPTPGVPHIQQGDEPCAVQATSQEMQRNRTRRRVSTEVGAVATIPAHRQLRPRFEFKPQLQSPKRSRVVSHGLKCKELLMTPLLSILFGIAFIMKRQSFDVIYFQKIT